ncbi:unnamed protein product [Prorocentrum cordatum]|uniref:Uncharacterized protein n=1 Tax=Prorocentrum cordatum TaxID=2364126 RepID=A0ABN9Q021_9DINO|nr:unnamed protein product [Polarella glacialis]
MQRAEVGAARARGVCARPKHVNHISLASGRSDAADRERIRRIYEPSGTGPEAEQLREAYSYPSFDLVLSRLLKSSTYDPSDLQPHKFEECSRMPVLKLK